MDETVVPDEDEEFRTNVSILPIRQNENKNTIPLQHEIVVTQPKYMMIDE